MYSPRVRQLVAELRYSGRLDDATHRGQRENPVCGDSIRFDLRVAQGRVEACSFLASGCVAAIAAAAALAKMCQNQSVQGCLHLTPEDLRTELDPLPAHKLHAVSLALEALDEALHSPLRP